MDGVGQPQLFPNYLEEAGTHVAAQDQLEHGGCVAPGIARRHPRAPQDQVDLLQVSGEGVDPGMGGDGLAFSARGAVDKPFETGGHQVHHFLVPDPAGGGHYRVRRPVGDPAVSQQVFLADRGDVLRFPQDGAPEGVVPPEVPGKVDLYQFFRIVILGVNLFQNDLPFPVQVLRRQLGPEDQVAQQVHQPGEVLRQHPPVEAGLLLAGKSVAQAA